MISTHGEIILSENWCNTMKINILSVVFLYEFIGRILLLCIKKDSLDLFVLLNWPKYPEVWPIVEVNRVKSHSG